MRSREGVARSSPADDQRENGASPSSPSSTASYSTTTLLLLPKMATSVSPLPFLALSHPLRASVSIALPRPLARPLKGTNQPKSPIHPFAPTSETDKNTSPLVLVDLTQQSDRGPSLLFHMLNVCSSKAEVKLSLARDLVGSPSDSKLTTPSPFYPSASS